jgi:SAM-dependent methyltransferase
LAALHTARAYFGHPYFEARRDLGRESIRSKYRSILSLLTNGASQPGARLLDIGCDTGALLAFASEEFGWTVTGVEVSPLAAEAARRVHGIEVLADDVMNLDLPVGGYDYVTLVDVLEHTTEPLRLLAKLRRVLRQGGRLYVATSDHDALINSLILLLYRIAGRRSWPILEKLYIPYHEFYFNRTTLARAVMQSGFRVLYHQSREFPLDEFGHGWILKMGLVPIFLLQMVLRRPTLQELVAVKAA